MPNLVDCHFFIPIQFSVDYSVLFEEVADLVARVKKVVISHMGIVG